MPRNPNSPHTSGCGPIHTHTNASENIKLQVMMAKLEDSLKNEFVLKDQLKTINLESLFGAGNINIKSIDRIEKSSDGLTDTYTIYFNNSSEPYSFSVTNGRDGQNGTDGSNGSDGVDGREIELTVDETYIKWRYDRDESWSNLVALSALKGADGKDGQDGVDGKDGADGTNGQNGKDGVDGREVELNVDQTSSYIQWRLTGDENWTNLISLNDLKGADGSDGVNGTNGADGKDGRDIVLKVVEDAVVWFYKDEENDSSKHIVLFALSDLKGEKGDAGSDGISFTYEMLTPEQKAELKGEQGPVGPQGPAGQDGVGIRLKASRLDCQSIGDAYITNDPESAQYGHIFTLTNLDPITFEDGGVIKGPKGDKGDQGEIGPKGDKGEKGDKGDKGDTGAVGPQGQRGLKGDTGNGITNISYEGSHTGTDGVVVDTYAIHFSDMDARTFTVTNGAKGEAGPGISEIQKVGESDSYTTYCIIFENSSTPNFTYQIPHGKQGPQGEQGPRGEAGVDGKSAYQVWRDLGYTGTEAEFIASLKGEDGQSGADGKSAYQSWLDSGYAGTELEFTTWLKGEKGDAGIAGKDGISPLLRIAENVWEVSYDNGLTYTSTGVVAVGPSGENGAQGSAGQDGVGIADIKHDRNDVNGNCVYVITLTDGRTEEFTVYKGEQGEQGETGPQGPQGEPGVGIQLKPDSNSCINPGDSYVVTNKPGDYFADGLFIEYGHIAILADVATRTFTDGGYIRGDKGDKGEQGIPGERGPQGETGPQGPEGPQGPKGEQGSQGIQGPQGEKGEQGETGAAGITPHIGDNNHWFIGETDTGILAIGRTGTDGKDGLTTVIKIGEDSYTHVNGTIELPEFVVKEDIYTKTETIEYVNNNIANAVEGLATESWVEAKGYLTAHQSLADYAKKSELFSKDYNDLVNKPTIPNVEGLASETYVDSKVTGLATESFVTAKIAEAELSGGDVDLTGYATKDDIAEFVTLEDVRAEGYLTTHQDISHLATKAEIPSLAGYARTSDLFSKDYNDLENKPTLFSGSYNDLTDKPVIPDTSKFVTMEAVEAKGYLTAIPSEYITETELNNKGFITSHQDISGKVDKSELNNYYTKTQVDNTFATNTVVTQATEAITTLETQVNNLEIPSIDGLATESWVEDKNYLTNQSLNNYYTQTQIHEKFLSVEEAATKAYVATKADDIPFKDDSKWDTTVTVAQGNFKVGDSVKNLTVTEILAKLLGLSDVTTPEEPQIPTEPAELLEYLAENNKSSYVYANASSTELTQVPNTDPVTWTPKEATESMDGMSTKYIIKDGDTVVEAGYQQATVYHNEAWLTVALPSEITDIKVKVYDPDVGENGGWVEPDNWGMIKAVEQPIAGYTVWTVPELAMVDGGATYRFVINN